ncbi:DUF1295-domain-containing protein [Violaceomyces palustris]|uniref:DUF1295-domain-containing protein n=1 Tax=Violaceomyces palustris TaxID=1673888 RepID=A0ACD0NWA4_9BASI|nr:DUF1295-domain-containing protein [Violaceomyces palustris]
MTAYTAGLKSLLPTFGVIYGFQALCGGLAIPYKTEKYYDLCGSLGFISAVGLSLYLPSIRARWITEGSLTRISALPPISSFHPRQLIMSGLTIFWAARLGTFLYQRVKRSGGDSRFDEIKKDPAKFFGAWMMQATWIAMTALPVFLVNSIPRASQPSLGVRDYAGLAIWLAGMGLEIVADNQKTRWRREKDQGKHQEKFLESGVWSWSRHPNYFGEVTLWTGQYVLSISALANAQPFYRPWVAGAAIVSPALEYALIRYLSGVPLLEKSAETRFKDDPRWKEYKSKVPCFVPFFGSKD